MSNRLITELIEIPEGTSLIISCEGDCRIWTIWEFDKETDKFIAYTNHEDIIQTLEYTGDYNICITFASYILTDNIPIANLSDYNITLVNA